MAKIAETLTGFSQLRGNISGKQDLRYAENNNKAFESPVGKVNYARNYRPSVICAKRAKDGRMYFQIRTKNAVNMTAKAVKAMALMGGTGALVGSLLAHKSGTPYQQMYALWQYALAHDASYAGYSFRKFASEIIRPKLEAKAQNITAQIASISLSFKNPWYDASQTVGANVSSKVLVEFWAQLSPDPISFTVDGKKGVAKDGMFFADVIGLTALNTLGLSMQHVGNNDYVVKGEGNFLKLDSAYIKVTDQPANLEEYVTTEVVPE